MPSFKTTVDLFTQSAPQNNDTSVIQCVVIYKSSFKIYVGLFTQSAPQNSDTSVVQFVVYLQVIE